MNNLQSQEYSQLRSQDLHNDKLSIITSLEQRESMFICPHRAPNQLLLLNVATVS